MDDKYTDKQVCDILGDNHFSNLLQYVLHMFGTMPRIMTEEEIIQYLKMNMKIGIAFSFMPNQVREWVYIAPISIFRFFDGKEWIKSEKPVIRDNDIICLPDNYELKKIEKTGEWIDFEIDENGCYRILDTDMRFHWSEWNKPLWIYEKDENRSWYLTSFGGYLYAGCNDWFMTPRIFYNNRLLDHYQKIEIDGKIVKPVIPVKIRFWREIK